MRGKISLIWMPGTLVGIGVYGPRTSLGALGFMSHVSSWLGAPTSMRTMQFTSAASVTAPDAFSANRSESENPSRPRAPACRKSRRFMPSQKWTGLAASSWIIPLPPWPEDSTPKASPSPRGASALLPDDGEKGLHVDEVLRAVGPERLQQRAAVRHQCGIGRRVRVGLVIPREAETIDALPGARRLDVDEAVRPGQRRDHRCDRPR